MLLQLKRSSSLRGFMPVYSLEITDDGLMTFHGQLWTRYNVLGDFSIEAIERRLSKKQIDDVALLIKDKLPISIPQIISQVSEFPSVTFTLPKSQKEITAFVSYWDEMDESIALDLTKNALLEASIALDSISTHNLEKLAEINFFIYQIEQILEVPQLIRSFFLTKRTGEITKRPNALVNWELVSIGEISFFPNDVTKQPKSVEQVLNLFREHPQLKHFKLICLGVCNNQKKCVSWIQNNETKDSLAQYKFIQIEFFESSNFIDDPILAIQINPHIENPSTQIHFLKAALLATTNSISQAKEISTKLFMK